MPEVKFTREQAVEIIWTYQEFRWLVESEAIMDAAFPDIDWRAIVKEVP